MSYLIIPLFTVVTMVLGGWLTKLGMVWYDTLQLPTIAPVGSVIGAVWTILFVLATWAALSWWNSQTTRKRVLQFKTVVWLFVINATLNVLWSYLFFYKHLVYLAIWEAGVLGLSVILIIILAWKHHRITAYLMTPYALWVSFATYLTYLIWSLNF